MWQLQLIDASFLCGVRKNVGEHRGRCRRRGACGHRVGVRPGSGLAPGFGAAEAGLWEEPCRAFEVQLTYIIDQLRVNPKIGTCQLKDRMDRLIHSSTAIHQQCRLCATCCWWFSARICWQRFRFKLLRTWHVMPCKSARSLDAQNMNPLILMLL